MRPCVSIIITLYNAEKWLSRCIDCALNQTLTDVEILLIDDGSTDLSASICDSYSEKDSRIIVFHKQNEGVSIARQFGLDHARGEYFIFLDADDFIKPSIYETMYRAAKEQFADLVVCDWISVEGNIEYSEGLRVKKWDAYHLLYALLRDQPTYQTVFLFKREFIKRHSIAFPSGKVLYGEDTLMVIDYLLSGLHDPKGFTVVHVPKHLYYYDRTINPSSLMKKTRQDMNRTRIQLWSSIKGKISEQSLLKPLYDRIVYYLFSALWNEYDDMITYCKEYSSMLSDIKQYASCSIKKRIVCQSLKRGENTILKKRWIAAPIILKEKYLQWKREKTGIIHERIDA